MSYDLSLIIEPINQINYVNDSTSLLGYNRLKLDWWDEEIFNYLNEMCPIFERSVSMYQDEGLINTNVDKYGNHLKYITAHLLSILLMNKYNKLTPWTRAVFYFINELPAETRIVIYWY